MASGIISAQITNAARTLYAASLLPGGPAVSPAISYASLGLGAGLLGSALTSGQTYSTLTLQAPLPAAGLAAGAVLTLLFGQTQSQSLTVATTAPGGQNSISVQPFTANAAYPAGAGVLTTPQASDLQLENEFYRKTGLTVVAGATPGEILASIYWSSADAPGQTYLELGFWASDASTTLGSGTLLARAVYWFPHTGNDSASAQIDFTI